VPAKEREVAGDRVDRCVTGIDGLDNILNGGIPRGNTVLVTGAVGTGKTSMCMEFLVHGALSGENSLFLSVTESTQKLLKNIIPYDFFDEKLVKEGRLHFIDIPVIYERLGLDKPEFGYEEIHILVDAIVSIAREMKIQRLVVDSITSVSYRLKSEEIIREFVLGLGSTMSAVGCTTLLVSEIAPTTERYSMYGVEEAIADGIIVMGNLERRGDLLRTLQVVKMRGTTHSRAKYVLDLTTTGVLLVPLLKGGSVAAGG
jgi:circadian clock protein KaiC